MARKIERITITDEGRDKGKTFVLTEMPADQADIWATQALCLLEQAGINIPEDAKGAGMAGLATVGVDSSVAQLRALQHPSLSSMWDYVAYQPPNLSIAPQPLLPGAGSQIEEIRTRTQLRFSMLALHTGFFSPEKASTSGSASSPAQPA